MNIFFHFHYLVLLICLSSTIHLSYCAGSIIPGQPLYSNTTIFSSEGSFILTYFTPGKSNKYYIGIRFTNSQHTSIVWVANRNRPISDPSSSQLKIALDGNLVIIDKYNEKIWSTNLSSIHSNSTQAALLDNGNLVLTERRTSQVLWQSFDHPTDTWLYGGKIGFNNLTNSSQMLTSWTSEDDPAEGRYSLKIDFTGDIPHLALFNGSKVYWFDDSYPYRSENLYATITYNSDGNGTYFSTYLQIRQIFAQLHVSGKMGIWSESSAVDTVPNCVTTKCSFYSICDDTSFPPTCKCATGYKPRNSEGWASANFSDGCLRITSAECEEMKEDSFLTANGLQKLSDNNVTVHENFPQCERKCLNDCQCTAYIRNYDTCLIWYGDLVFTTQTSTAAYYRLPKLEQDATDPRKKVIFIVGGVVALLVFLLAFLYRYSRRNQLIIVPEPVDEYMTTFSFRCLKKATQNFSEKLGEGGFGSVFKGKLPDSTYIAVKRFKYVNTGEKQFRSEVKSVGMIHHINLVRLRGFCADKTHRMLVYEYMPRGSLDSYLSGKSSRVLDWGTRYKIATGAAQGLVYLHESCHECIIHCDIKPGNILLDEEFNAKVADFGLAKLFDRDFSRVLTTMRGTLGYIAPEWLLGDAITPKVDVYSYGMMLFEIISGRRNLEVVGDDEVDYFPTRAANKINREEEVMSLLDQKLEGNANEEELTRALRVALWCIQDAAEDRPSMKLIVQILQGVVQVGVPPVPRFLQIFE